jgi:ATP-dependent exoDNAse (exonuclease V) beta subunit
MKIHFVSAGAGSGKTYKLTEILYEKLASGETTPAGVIATTFTRRAATELRERVRSALLRKGAFSLSNTMGQAQIGTVNSVCGGLLERFAFEAGLATEQRVLDEKQAAAIMRQAIDEVAEEEILSELITVASRLGIDDWHEPLRMLIDQARSNDIDTALIPGFAGENVRALISHFPNVTKEDLDQSLMRALESALPALREGGARGVKKTVDYLSLVQDMLEQLKEGTSAWSQWVKLEKEQPEAALKAFVEPISVIAGRYAEHSRLHSDIGKYLEIMFSLCARALDVYAAQKRELGVVDFTDQEHLFLRLMDNAGVADVLREELELLLVDEFQDTSPIQLALFLKLAGFARETYWVGDIKQAIYGFRGSDAALMQGVLAALPGIGGRTEILGRSWRSRPPLVRLVNALFSKAFADELKPNEVELQPTRTELLEGPAFANWLLNGKNRGLQFSALAAGVRELVASDYAVVDPATGAVRPVNYGDIAILSRSNDGVKQIAGALRAAGVPWATQQPGLLRTPEAALALACLRRLNDPGDTIASAEIIALADSAEPETWLADRLRYLAAGAEAEKWREDGPAGHPILAKLATLRSSLSVLSPREAMSVVIAECDLAGTVLRWKRNELVARVRLANLEAILRLAQSYEEACRATNDTATVSGLILWLEEQAEDGLDMLAEPATDAVSVLTHHGAKGLEWPVVILTDLAADIKDRLWNASMLSRDQLDVSDPLRDRFIHYWPWPFGRQAKVGLAEEVAQSKIAQEFRAKAVREEKRLLYVSMTRARDLLVLARVAKKQTGEWLDALEAPWLLPGQTTDTLALPVKGAIPYSIMTFDPPENGSAPPDAESPLYWFRASDTHTPRLPLVFSPSSAPPKPCQIIEQVKLGERIKLGPGADMVTIGNVIHACIAASVTNATAPLRRTEVSDIISGMGAENWVETDDVQRQVKALLQWIAKRWPGCGLRSEIPIESLLENGQTLRGRIDLLIQLQDSWILIDHKANPRGADQWDDLAQGYSGQLSAYADAVTRTTGQSVQEMWLFMPVAAAAVRIGLL